MNLKLDKTLEVLKHSGLSATEKLIFIALSICNSKQRGCYPSREYLAKMTNLSISSISRAVNKLKSLGIIEINRRYNKSNYYEINSDVKVNGIIGDTIKPDSNGINGESQSNHSERLNGATAQVNRVIDDSLYNNEIIRNNNLYSKKNNFNFSEKSKPLTISENQDSDNPTISKADTPKPETEYDRLMREKATKKENALLPKTDLKYYSIYPESEIEKDMQLILKDKRIETATGIYYLVKPIDRDAAIGLIKQYELTNFKIN